MATEVVKSQLSELEQQEAELRMQAQQIEEAIAELKEPLTQLGGQISVVRRQLDDLESRRSAILSAERRLKDDLTEIQEKLASVGRSKTLIKASNRAAEIVGRQIAAQTDKSITPQAQNFINVLSAICTDKTARIHLADLLESNISFYGQSNDEGRIRIATPTNSCRLVLSSDGVHLIVYHAKTDDERAVVREMQNQVQLARTNKLVWPDGYTLKPVTLGLEVDTTADQLEMQPVFLLQGKKDGDIKLLPFQPQGPSTIISTMRDILSTGDILLPKSLGKYRIQRDQIDLT